MKDDAVVKQGHQYVAAIIRMIAYVLLGVVWIWCMAGIYCLDVYFSKPAALSLTIGLLASPPVLLIRNRAVSKSLLAIIAIASFGLIASLSVLRPSNDRIWSEAQAKLPTAEIDDNTVSIKQIRSFRYRDGALQKRYFDLEVDLGNIRSVWFGVDRFSSIDALAHTFLSFEIENNGRSTYVAFSVETRRELSEKMFSPLRGIFNNYELIYVIADEQDVLSLRSNVRQHEVQLYPLRATQEQARQIFVDMLERANAIADHPEFYNTVTNNCTNNLVYHANKILEAKINPASRAIVFPGRSDRLIYEYGMIDSELSFEQARARYRVDEAVSKYDGEPDFSSFIRIHSKRN